MIRAFLRAATRADLRLWVGLLLVAAIAFVALAGAAHAAGGTHDEAGADCTVCDAVLATCGAVLAAPAPTLHAVETPSSPAPTPVLLPLVAEPGRVAAPRGPPARS